MILENGAIRTLDPSLPESRALAIAGDRIAGGVGVHETALASPQTVDLGGRCVLPGFTDSHVLPDVGAHAARGKLDGCTSLDEALALIRGAEAPGPGYAATAGATPTTDALPTRADLARSPATGPP